MSDLDGKSATPELTSLVTSFLTSRGYTVSVNSPYKGGQIVKLHGGQCGSGKRCSTSGIHSIQIEINRSLYLDEDKCTLHTGFWSLRDTIQELTKALQRKLESLLHTKAAELEVEEKEEGNQLGA